MKNLILLVLVISTLSCKAQSLIKSLDGDGSCPPYDANCYEKDVNNEFEKFVGEWKYQAGNDTFIINLKKDLHYQIQEGRNYMDLLVGEYQYIENGVEKVNSLSDFDNPTVRGYEHNISGGIFLHRLPSYCVDNSQPQEIKIKLSIKDPSNSFISGDIILRFTNNNGAEKLEVCVRDSSTLADDENANIPMPDGYYEFIKQN